MQGTSTANGTYDVVFIGGGHNALVGAAYLAKSGRKVCILERRNVLGGAACTEETWPGFKVSTAAYVISLFQPAIISDLALRDYGLTILPRNPSSFTPLPNGQSLLLGPDSAANCREIAKFSQRDAEAFPRYERLLERVASTIEPILAKPAPDLFPMPSVWRKIGWRKKVADWSSMWPLYGALAKLGGKLPEAIELLLGSARPILERWFESEVLRATLATDAIIGSFQSISAPGSAYVLMHHVMGEAGGARGIWGYVKGGMGGLADSLEKACLNLGVTILRDSPVSKILVENGAARGVALESGAEIGARAVASTVDAHLTMERMLTPSELPEDYLAAVKRIDYSSASMKINLALSEPPRFLAQPISGVGPHHHGTMHIGPTLDYLERAYDDAKYGRPSQEPILEITMPTAVDNSIAPAGNHLINIFVQYAPYKLAEGTWDGERERFADRCIDTLAKYAPNVPRAILHRQVLAPPDLERMFGLTGGNIFQGAMSPWQLFSMRPVVGWADHRTPIEGLYMCGAASHPGGGVMGTCGKNGAAAILADGY